MPLNNKPISVDSLLREIELLKVENDKLKTENNRLQEGDKTDTKFETIFENSPFGNKIIDSDLTILQVNKSLVKLLGYPREEIVGSKILEYVPEELRREWRELQKNLWEKSIPLFSLDTCLLRKSGDTVCCQVTSILFKSEGNLLGYTIIEDKTAPINAQKQKDEFIGKISHELKTPVTSVKAFSQILMRTLAGKETSLEQIFLHRMNLQIVHLESLIKDLFDVTRMEGGKLVLNPSHFKADEFLSSLVNDLQHICPNHKLVITRNEKVDLYADKERINQVITNLINNAVKYSSGGSLVNVSVESDGRVVIFSVQDFGQGIPKKHIPNLFNKFHQVDNVNQNKGLGLGLYICKEISNKTGGNLWVESVEGEGSTFYFSLPVHNGG